MAQIKTNAMRILDKLNIQYTTHTYDITDGNVDGISVAKKLGEPNERVYKTLVTKSDKNHYVFIIPVEKELDLKKAAKSVKEKSLEMIKVADIIKITGYIRGGCSPIGMKKQYITVIHSDVLSMDKFIISAGKIGQQLDLSLEQLEKAIPLTIADIVH